MDLEKRLFNVTHTIQLDRNLYNYIVNNTPRIFGDRFRVGFTDSYEETRKYLLLNCVFWAPESWDSAFILCRIAASTYEECSEFKAVCEKDTLVCRRKSKEWSSTWDVWVNGEKLK